MKLHEYQAKELLKRFGVPVPPGEMVTTVNAAVEAARRLSGRVVVKAQIHAGGRGKGGGVKVVADADAAKQAATQILGMQLVTHQTGPQGQRVRNVLIEKASEIAHEFYLGLVLDRSRSRDTIMVSTEGGMEIEEVAARTPEKIKRVVVDPAVGLQGNQSRWLGFQLGLAAEQVKKFEPFVKGLYRAYVESDASLAEINPLVLTKSGDFLALDAKITLDDNALFRQKELAAWRDLDEEDPAEWEAKQYDLSYVSLDGTIGCMVNGAGLAMATMDIIHYYGGEPANFLDVGGSASEKNVMAAFKIILKDPKVKAILINIFGGIVKCDMIAGAIVAAAREVGVHLPLVVRLQGTNVEAGRKMLAESGLNITPAETLDDAARKVTGAAGVRGKS